METLGDVGVGEDGDGGEDVSEDGDGDVDGGAVDRGGALAEAMAQTVTLAEAMAPKIVGDVGDDGGVGVDEDAGEALTWTVTETMTTARTVAASSDLGGIVVVGGALSLALAATVT